MYRGVDVDARSIRWCEAHIHSRCSEFQFQLMDVKNQCYNPRGKPPDGSFRIPFPGKTFDIIYLYSVFSHMLPDDVRIYLREYRRLLSDSGTVFLTAFVEEGVPDAVENPPGYRMKWAFPLHCMRFSKSFFSALVIEAGFQIDGFDYGQETDGQSAFYLTPLRERDSRSGSDV